MISISHNDNDIIVLITAKDEIEMARLIKEMQGRYSEYQLQAKEEPRQGFDQRWSVVLVPTVELF